MSSQQYPFSHQEAFQALVKLLEKGDEAQSCYSAKAIAQAEYQAALPQLNACLYHGDVDVVISACQALSRLKKGDLDALLDVAQNHPDGDARQAALRALCQHTCLADKDGEERQTIIELLQAMTLGRAHNDHWGLTSEWDEWWDLQLLAVQLLTQLALPDTLPLLHSLLATDPEPELEMAIYQGLAQLDLAYCQQVLAEQPSLSQARKITKAITQNPSQAATILLFKQLTQSQDVEIKIICIQALVQRDSHTYQWDIAKQLCDENMRVQEVALKALKQMNALGEMSQDNLAALAKRQVGRNLTTILTLIDEHPDSVSPAFFDWLRDLLHLASFEHLIAAARLIAHKAVSTEHYHYAFERILNLVKEQQTPIALKIQAIHLLGEFHHKAGPLLTEFRTLLDEKHHDVMIRQACFESVSHFAHDNAYRALLMGAVLACETNDSLIPTQTTEEVSIQAAKGKEQTIQSEGQTIQVSSTLAAIAQGQQASMPNKQSAHQDPQQTHETRIHQMMDQLEGELDPYSHIVKQHFQAADQLNYKRKKIAKPAQLSNQVLAIRSLANCPNDFAAPLLLEALIGASPMLQAEIFDAMARLAEKQGTSRLTQAYGALANSLYHGTNLVKQAATRLLAQLRNRPYLELILLAAQDDDEHVRVCSLQALKAHMDAKPSVQLPLLEIQRCLQACLKDKAGGVRKLALPLLARLQQDEDVNSLIECAIHDEESQSIAAKNLHFAKDKSLSLLAKKLPLLENQAQYLAIQLTGQLLSTKEG